MMPKHLLIISTGRTGTTTIEAYLRNCQGFKVVQEPQPSHQQYMLSNISSLAIPGISGIARNQAVHLYEKTRGAWLKAFDGDVFVEINPFLSNIAADFSSVSVRPDAMLHLVREPVSWVNSMVQFGAYSWRRPVVRYVPFVYWRPPYGSSGWRNLSFAEKLANEWVYRNMALMKTADGPWRYKRMRYEDLFGNKSQVKTKLSDAMRELEIPPPFDLLDLPKTENASRTRPQAAITKSEIQSIQKITGALASQFGYKESITQFE